MSIKMKCAIEECTKRIMMGLACSYCNLDFCSKHRLPEFHECVELDKSITKQKEEDKEKIKDQVCKGSSC